MIKKILLPQDGSPNSKSALQYGLWLAGKFEADVTGLYVVDIVSLEGPFLHDVSGSLGFEPFLNLSAKMKETLEARGRTVLSSFSEWAARAAVPHATHIEFGVVVNEIAEKAALADVVVMGRRGVNARFEYALLGSVTEGVIRKSPVPVLIVPETFKAPEKPLLVLDGGASSKKAMHLAAEFSKTLELPLTVLTAGKDKGEADKVLGSAREYLGPYDIGAEFEFVEDEAPLAIEKYYKDKGHDLLFMGASRHSRVVEMVLGSAAEHVMRAVDGPFFLAR